MVWNWQRWLFEPRCPRSDETPAGAGSAQRGFLPECLRAVARRMQPARVAEVSPADLALRGVTATQYVERYGGYGKCRDIGNIQWQIAISPPDPFRATPENGPLPLEQTRSGRPMRWHTSKSSTRSRPEEGTPMQAVQTGQIPRKSQTQRKLPRQKQKLKHGKRKVKQKKKTSSDR